MPWSLSLPSVCRPGLCSHTKSKAMSAELGSSDSSQAVASAIAPPWSQHPSSFPLCTQRAEYMSCVDHSFLPCPLGHSDGRGLEGLLVPIGHRPALLATRHFLRGPTPSSRQQGTQACLHPSPCSSRPGPVAETTGSPISWINANGEYIWVQVFSGYLKAPVGAGGQPGVMVQ